MHNDAIICTMMLGLGVFYNIYPQTDPPMGGHIFKYLTCLPWVFGNRTSYLSSILIETYCKMMLSKMIILHHFCANSSFLGKYDFTDENSRRGYNPTICYGQISSHTNMSTSASRIWVFSCKTHKILVS